MLKLTTAALLSLLMATTSSAAEPQSLTVEEGYVRGLPPTAINTAAYMRLINTGTQPLVLVGASSPAVSHVELHESYEEDGLVSMRHVAEAEVPAGGELRLRTGGLHLMLMELNKPLADGDEVQLILEFASGESKALTLPVRNVMTENQSTGHAH